MMQKIYQFCCAALFSWLISNNNAVALRIISDAETQSVIEDIAKPIFRTAGLDDEFVEVHIVMDDSMNAFVFDGQKIFIHTGLIKFSNSPEAIAGVIAHEVGHIIGGHLVQYKSQEDILKAANIIGFLAGGILGIASKSSDVGLATMTAADSIALGNYFAFSRGQESAADSVAINIMNKLGVCNDGLVEFLQEIALSERIFHSNIVNYYKSHPVSSDRIKFLKRNSKQCSQSYLSRDIYDKFNIINAKIKAFTINISEGADLLSTLSGASKEYAKSILYYRDNKLQDAILQMQNLIKQNPNNPYFHEFIAEIYFSAGNLNAAITNYQKAHILNKKSDLLALMYAISLVKGGINLTEAKSILYNLIDKQNGFTAWNTLSKIYHHEQKDAMMHLSSAYAFYHLSDFKTAMIHLKKAKKASHSFSAFEMKKFNDLQSILEERK